MPSYKQIIEYCLSASRFSKKKEKEGYQQFLELYFQRYEDVGDVSDVYAYFADSASAAYAFILKHLDQPLAIDANGVHVAADYSRQMVRVYILYDDTPFAPDSIRATLRHLNFKVFRSNLLPNFHVTKNGQNLSFDQLESKGKTLYWLDIESLSDEYDLAELKAELKNVMLNVSCVVRDWRRMQDALRMVMYAWQDHDADLISDQIIQENLLLMEWLLHHFTFLGYAGYKVNSGKVRKIGKSWGLDIPNLCAKNVYLGEKTSHGEDTEYPLFMMTKVTEVFRVHRYVTPDVLILNVYDSKGHVMEQHHFMGMLTADAYTQDVDGIPVLRQKVKKLITMQKLRSRYMVRKLKHLIKSYPLEELIQADVHHLSRNFDQILRADERQKAEVDIRLDALGCFYSVMVYAPKDIFKTSLRHQIQQTLVKAFSGSLMHYSPYFTESALVRMHFVIQSDEVLEDELHLKNELKALCVSWGNGLASRLCALLGPKKGYQLSKRFLVSMSELYQAAHSYEVAAVDAIKYHEMNGNKDLAVHVDLKDEQTIISVYQLGLQQRLTLNSVFPMLNNLGFEVLSEGYFEEHVADDVFHLSRYRCQYAQQQDLVCRDAEEIERSILAVLLNQATDDRLNALVIYACMSLDKVDVIRAYIEYVHQIGFGLSKTRIIEFFVRSVEFAQLFVKLFTVRFQPALVKREQLSRRYRKRIVELSQLAKTSDDERIIAMFLHCLDATVRSNFCMPNRVALALKIDAKNMPGLSTPCPLYHAFVYGERVMGIHIRYSRVSRGGIRCSDRVDDFHEEVSRLAATQRLKNTLTIPDGGKGGFVCRNIDRVAAESKKNEIESCYRIFISSLLSLSDNMLRSRVTAASYLHVYDQPDPYFVVAADKGTAALSPVANEISEQHNFWLGDAFASGGQNGYDHKKMGITARGAWESVKWHAQKLKLDVANDSFRVIGIGDMSGDVFGNGMLLSDKICLVAAFGYGRIFIDPNPDEAVSYQERLRLFRAPGSTWGDYDPTLISAGGGVFSRSEKYIELTPQMKKLFQTSKARMEPSEMISAILCLPVELIWNGGIGVFVKASSEANYDVKDVTNDAVRVDATQLKAKIFAEGGNNGLTQQARIEYAINGGLINTDFIDNSAGVNVSDLEVNLKILFKVAIDAGYMDELERNKIIKKLSKQVSDLVLWNNFLQNTLIDLSIYEVESLMHQYIRFMDLLEMKGLIDRQSDCLPTKQIIKARQGSAILTRPEAAVLLSYSKIYLAQLLENSDLISSKPASIYLQEYFPRYIQDNYQDIIKKHPLKESIIRTQLVNTLISEMGIVFVTQVMDECACTSDEVVLAYTVARSVLGIDGLYKEVMASHKISYAFKLEIAGNMKRSVYLSVRWILRHLDLKKINHILKDYGGIHELSVHMLNHLPRKYTHRSQKILLQLQKFKVPAALIDRIKYVRYAYQLFNVRFAQIHTKMDDASVVLVYYQVAAWLKFHQLRERLLGIQEQTYWDRIQKYALEDEFSQIITLITIKVIQFAKHHKIDPENAMRQWVDSAYDVQAQIRVPLIELLDLRVMDYSMCSVVIGRIRKLISDTD